MFPTPDLHYIKSDALILRRSDYSETSIVMLLLTREQGCVSVLAKGARRPRHIFEGEIDLLARGQAVILLRPRASMQILTEFSCRERYLGLRKSRGRTIAAHYAAEVAVDASPEGHGEPEIYDLLDQALGGLEHGDVAAVLSYFQVHLLRLSGYAPNLRECSMCGTPIDAATMAYSFIHRGLTCEQCRFEEDRSTTVSRAAITLIGSLGRGIVSDPARVHIPQALACETVTFLAYVIAASFEHEPRMLQPLLKMVRGGEA